jgi:DNA-binding LytR/AlgR family response regulator
MKVLIVEDEPMARSLLARTLQENFSDIEIIGETASVKETVAFLGSHEPDVIFMDVELEDGNCFEIFRQTDVKAHVVMTTAYDNYAVKAFEVNSVDYLLKPIGLAELKRAVERCRKGEDSTIKNILSALSMGKEDKPGYREKFLFHVGDKIVPVMSSDISVIYSESKGTYASTKDGRSFVVDSSLDAIEGEMDPKKFYRISRGCIVAKDSVESATKLFGGRLRLTLKEGVADVHSIDLTVSRARSEGFLDWLGA